MKKSLATASVEDRHALIIAIQPQEKPPMSVRHLCKLLHVNRRWYYARRKGNVTAEADLKLREAIEPIV